MLVEEYLNPWIILWPSALFLPSDLNLSVACILWWSRNGGGGVEGPDPFDLN